MIERLSDEQLARRLDLVESLIVRERDPKQLASWNALFQRLLLEQVRRDRDRDRESANDEARDHAV